MLIQSKKELADWAEYRKYLKIRAKDIGADAIPFFVSKEKFDFEIMGKPWRGHALFIGEKGRLGAQKLRKEGVLFREGTARSDGDTVLLEGLLPKLIKEAKKTALKLKIGLRLDAAAGVDLDGEGEDSLEAPTPKQQKDWEKLKAVVLPRLKKHLETKPPEGEKLKAIVKLANKKQDSGDFKAAIGALTKLAQILAKTKASSSGSADDAMLKQVELDVQKRSAKIGARQKALREHLKGGGDQDEAWLDGASERVGNLQAELEESLQAMQSQLRDLEEVNRG